MAKLLKLRRGTTTQHGSFTGAEGEVTVDTDKETLVVHDGSTAGGHPVAAEDMANVSSAAIAGRLSNDSIAPSKIAAGSLPSDVSVSDASLPNSISSDITGNSDTVDNLHASSFVRSDADDTLNGVYTISDSENEKLILSGSNQPFIRWQEGTTDAAYIQWQNSTNEFLIINQVSSEQIRLGSGANGLKFKEGGTERTVWHAGNDGSGSGLDADTLDGVQASNFLRSDQNDSTSGTLTTSTLLAGSAINAGSSAIFQANGFIRTGAIGIHPGGTTTPATTGERWLHSDSSGVLRWGTAASNADATIWHSGNDGSGSNLDADLWDGNQFSSYLNQAVKTDSNVTFGVIHLDGTVNSSSAGAVYGRNHAYDTTELRGHGAEFMIGAKSADIHINYRTCNNGATNNTPTTWYWRAGASNNFSNHNFGNVTANGSVTATGNVTAYSDARLKTDIHTINDALSICGKLRGVSYKWIKDGKASIGVIAQEVEEVVPEVVQTIQENIGTKEEPEYREVKTVDYGKMVGVLINAINELKAELDEHKKGGK